MKTMKVVKRVGYIDKNRKYDSPCAQSYIEYEQCLQQTEFNRVKCLPK